VEDTVTYLNRPALAFLLFTVTLSGIAIIAQQAPADDGRRNAIVVMRAINTAENAVRQRGGKYVPMAELVEHPAMGGVKADIAVNVDGSTYAYKGGQLRLALAADATQYVVTFAPTETCGTASFTDERGMIYAGKVLDC